MQTLQEYFSLLDTDNDGKIQKNDVILIVRGIGIPGFDSDFDNVIRGMNANAASFCFDEVLNIAISLKKTQTSTSSFGYTFFSFPLDSSLLLYLW